MKTLVIQLTDSYLLHLTVTDWKDTKTLKFSSQWTGAKHPYALQSRFQVTMSKDQLNEVVKFVEES